MFSKMHLVIFSLSLFAGCILFLNENTTYIPGSSGAFQPVGNYKDVIEYAGPGSRLTEMDSYKVESNGTINLDADYETGSGHVNYFFFRPLTEDEKNEIKIETRKRANQKIGTYKKTNRSAPLYKWILVQIREGRYDTAVDEEGYTHYYGYIGGMQRTIKSISHAQESIPNPLCTFKQLWQTAIANNTPKNAVADISYNKDGYTFSINQIGVTLKFDHHCNLIKSKSKFYSTGQQ